MSLAQTPDLHTVDQHWHHALLASTQLLKQTGPVADLTRTVQGSSVRWAPETVSLQLALDDVSRIDSEPIHSPCCTASYHQGPLPQLIAIAQTLSKCRSC